MKFKREIDENGEWMDADGQRYSLSVVRRLRNAAGVNVGYEDFDSLEAALAAWGLSAAPASISFQNEAFNQ